MINLGGILNISWKRRHNAVTTFEFRTKMCFGYTRRRRRQHKQQAKQQLSDMHHAFLHVCFDGDLKDPTTRTATRTSKNRFYKQNNNFARASRFFVYFFARFCTTTTWKFLISPFMEDGRKQATTKFYFSFCTWIWSLGIQLQEGRLHLTK